MESTVEDDPTLPIDFDQTSNFAMFLKQASHLNDADETQSDTLSETMNHTQIENEERKKKRKQRSHSTTDQPVLERPLSRGTMREEEAVISELKKENFGLKMRIYYMEERLHDTFDASTEDVLKKNIELKVNIEELKRDVGDKSDLLSKAYLAMEQLSYEHEKELGEFTNKFSKENIDTENKYQCELRLKNQEIDKLKKREIKPEEAKEKSQELQQLHDRIRELEVLNIKIVEETNVKTKEIQKSRDAKEDDFRKKIKELELTIQNKDGNIESLRKDIDKLANSSERSNQHYKKLYERLNEEVSTKDNTINELKEELASKVNLAEALKEHISNAEKSIKNLRSSLHEKEIEGQKSVSHLEDQIKAINEQLEAKEKQLDDKDAQLSKIKQEKLRANTQRVQFELESMRNKDSEIVELKLRLKQQDFDQEKLKLLVDEKDKDIVFFSNSKLKLEDEYQKYKDSSQEQFKQIKQDSEKQNHDKRKIINELKEVCLSLQEKLQKQSEQKDKVIENLANAICVKDKIIGDFCEMDKPSNSRDSGGISVIENLNHRMKERDKQDKKSFDEYINSIKKKDQEILKLQTSLREKENSLLHELSKCETLTAQLEGLEKANTDGQKMIQNLKLLLEKSEKNYRECQEKSFQVLKDKDDAITKTTGRLSVKEQEVKNLILYFNEFYANNPIQPNSFSPEIVAEKINNSILNTDTIIEELTTLKEQSIKATKLKLEELLSIIKDKDQTIKELHKSVMNTENDKQHLLNELNAQLLSAEEELRSVNTALLKLKNSQELETEMFYQTVNEKDETINALVKNGEEKDNIISNLKGYNRKEKGKIGEMTKLREIVAILKGDSLRKDEQMSELIQENDNLKEKLSEVKDSIDGKLIERAEKEKKDFQAEKEEEQYKNLLFGKLEDLVKAAETEKEKYADLSNKLKNNKDTQSQLSLLDHELSDVKKHRERLQQLLFKSLRALSGKLSTGDDVKQERELALTHLEKNLEDKDKKITSLLLDLKLCKTEVKQLNADLVLVKSDCEQLVQDRDREIFLIRKQLEKTKEDNTMIVLAKENLNKELVDCQKKLDILRLKLDGSSSQNVELTQNKEDLMRLRAKLLEKDDDIHELQKKFEVQSTKNDALKLNLLEAEAKSQQLNNDLTNMTNNMARADTNIAALEAQLTDNSNGTKEKKQLKKDIKELCNINERLRSKVKEMTKSYDQLKCEKESERNSLYEEIQKGKKIIKELENDLSCRQNQITEIQDEFHSVKEQAVECNLLTQKCEELRLENENYQHEIDDLKIALETQRNLLQPQTKLLETELIELKKENSTLKRQQKQHEVTALNLNTATTKLDDAKRENQKLASENFNLNKELEKTKLHLEKLEEEIDVAHSQISMLTNELTHLNQDQDRFLDLQKETDYLTEQKRKLELKLDELKTSKQDIQQILSVSKEENLAKDKRINFLTFKVVKLSEQLESFSPIHTSSQQNIVLSSEAFTQTKDFKPSNENEKDRRHVDDSSLIAMHIQEMRELRKQLEETIKNNDALRSQLEERLSKVEQDASMIHDPHMRIKLVRENDTLREKITEKDTNIKQMTLEIKDLHTERIGDKDTITDLRKQIHDLNELSTTLKMEMEVYDRLVKQLGIDKTKQNFENTENRNESDKDILRVLLGEIRILREQLQRSMEVNEALRQKLEEELGRPVSLSPLPTPQDDLATKRHLFSSALIDVGISTDDDDTSESKSISDYFSPHETPMKQEDWERYVSLDKKNNPAQSHLSSLTDKCYICGTSKDYVSLKKVSVKSLDYITLAQKKITAFCKRNDFSNMESLLKDINKTKKYIKEIFRLFNTFVLLNITDMDNGQEVKDLRAEIARLKKLLSSKELYIKSTLNMIEDHNWKSELEESIKQQLIKTRETLKATKGTLQKKVDRSHESSGSLSLNSTAQKSRDVV